MAAMVRTRAPPGGRDHVEALLHGDARPISRAESNARRVRDYAEALRLQMESQRERKQRMEDEYHSRPRQRAPPQPMQRSRSPPQQHARFSPAPADHHTYNTYNSAGGNGGYEEPRRLQPRSPAPALDSFPAASAALAGVPAQHTISPQYGTMSPGTYPPVIMIPSVMQVPSYSPPPHQQTGGYAPPNAHGPSAPSYHQTGYSPSQAHYGSDPDGDSALLPRESDPMMQARRRDGRRAEFSGQDSVFQGPSAFAPAVGSSAQGGGLMSFLNRTPPQDAAATRKAAYRAQLEQQMLADRESKRRAKEAEQAADQALLANMRKSNGTGPFDRRRGGGGEPVVPPAAQQQHHHSHPPGHTYGAHAGMDASQSPGHHDSYAMHQHTQGGYGSSSAMENTNVGFNTQQSQHQPYQQQQQQPPPPQESYRPGGGAHSPVPNPFAGAGEAGRAVPRGLANMETARNDTPLLNFKSDKAFLTREEVERKAAAANELKDYLAVQIEEKKRRQAAEKDAEARREAAEIARLEREQRELEDRQRRELQRERGGTTADQGKDAVAEAWRKAQEEAEALKASKHTARRRDASPGADQYADSGSPYDPGPSFPPAGAAISPDHAHAHATYRDSITPLVKPKFAAVRAEVATQLDAVRAEMASEKHRMVEALARQNAEMASLMERANRAEAQSRTAAAELEQMRRAMHARDADHAAATLLSAPAAPEQRLDPLRQRDALSSFMTDQPHGMGAAQHATAFHGFLADMPPTAGHLRHNGGAAIGGASRVVSARPRLELTQEQRMMEQSLTAHASFIPVKGPPPFDEFARPFDEFARPSPTSRGGPRLFSAPPRSPSGHKRAPATHRATEAAHRRHASHHHQIESSQPSATGGLHMRNNDKLAMLQAMPDGPTDQSLEALDAFLTRFVNQGSSIAPLYSKAASRMTPSEIVESPPTALGRPPSRESQASIAVGKTLSDVNRSTAAAVNTMSDALQALKQEEAERRTGDDASLTEAAAALAAQARVSEDAQPDESMREVDPRASDAVKASAAYTEGTGYTTDYGLDSSIDLGSTAKLDGMFSSAEGTPA